MVAGALSFLTGSPSVVDSPTTPCFCLDMSSKIVGDMSSSRNSIGRKRVFRNGSLDLSSTFVSSGKQHLCGVINRRGSWVRKQRRTSRLVIVNELGGQYDDNFEDVKTQILNYFTYKAVRTVMNQLYEMNPPQYTWLYQFVVTHKPGGDGKRFLRTLAKQNQGLAERVMITRLSLYGKWVKKCDHAEIYQGISDENLELMRERLLETVIWPSDDSNTEKIG